MRGSAGLLCKGARRLKEWHQAALNHSDTVRRSRMLPLWLPLAFVLFHFVLVGLAVRYTQGLSRTGWAVAVLLLDFCALAAVTITLVCSCRYYQVSSAALGIRPLNRRSDFRWS